MPKKLRTPQYVKLSSKGFRQKLYIPPFVFRPLRLTRRRALKSEYFRKAKWWFVLHRRTQYRRPMVGMDALEARAISEYIFNGTLPERIVYRYLVEKLRFQPDVDFIAQSALDGGRQEVGGIVADFVFPYHKFALQVQGFHHHLFIWSKRDYEQRMDFALKGWQYVEIFEEQIYDEYIFEDFMRRLFALPSTTSGSSLAYGSMEADYSILEKIMIELNAVQSSLSSQFGV